ncbi:MAG: Hpt domain-containing protein [Kordiimonadaceae bacterium]|nr:Hpt domain-containing protein [Kordiimonadaceae bacterium]
MAGNESEWDESLILDSAHLAEFTAGDEQLEQHVLALFSEHAPTYLKDLKTSSPNEWRTAAHKLKGAARSIGAWRLAREAERVERIGSGAARDAKRSETLEELGFRLDQLMTLISERHAV